MNNTNRVVLNTGFLYGKMMISMFIALYSTRIVLNTLGASDFGIFNLVAGVIAMLSFLNAAMATSTQRYMSFYIGAKDESKLNSIFKSSVILHLVIGTLIVILLEVAGVFIFDGFLNIAQDRIPIAKAVYHFMVISTFFTINSVPYDAAIIAHENLFFDAIVGVFESIMKLTIAIILTFSESDRLILYGILMASLIILIRIIKSVYCMGRYIECNFKGKLSFDIKLIKEMFIFSSWNTLGSLLYVGRAQGIILILNQFFGTVVIAAYGIGMQVGGQLVSFSSNMVKALDPQIMKSEGSDDRYRVLELSILGCKYSFFLLAVFALPICMNMDFVLNLWLGNVPLDTSIFCLIIVVNSLINQLTRGLQSAILSIGNVKPFQLFSGFSIVICLFFSWLLLKIGFPSYTTLLSITFMEISTGIFSIIFLSRNGMSIKHYLDKVIKPSFLCLTIGVLLLFFVRMNFDFQEPYYRLFEILGSFVIFIFVIYFLGLDTDERKFVNNTISKLLNISFRFS